MSLASVTSTITSILTDDLRAILDKCDFLTLTSNEQVFPNSRGSGLPILALNTAHCNALISFQGAQLLQFSASNGNPLLWVSPNCDFTHGVALRGGIPVCLPWFGPHPTDSKKPKHGYARNRDWQLTSAELLSDGCAQLIFNFISTKNELFEFDFIAQLTMTLGSSIELDLEIQNADKSAFDCSWVLHAYYPVSLLADVRVKGLADKTYLDNLEHHLPKYQCGDVSFIGEVDRVYPGIDNSVGIAGTPSIDITHHNCPSVVVWNPGATNAEKIADIGAGNEQGYICVERGAVLAEKWHLAPGEKRSAWVHIKEVTQN